MFSVIILTYNEEKSIKSCLESLNWCDDVILIDSGSTDKTVEIAKSFKARVFNNAFENFGQQRNYAIDSISFKYDWVFHLDADEHFNDELLNECNQAIHNYDYGAFMVPSKTFLWGTWLKKSGSYPVYQMRFHKLGDARFIQFGHGQRESEIMKGLGFLKTPYNHFAFEKGISTWFIKHIRYAEEEAQNNIKNKGIISLNAFFSKDNLVFRRNLKNFSARLPFRSLFKFVYLYIFKMGFLDGRSGLIYITMQCIYEQIIQIKEYEIKQNSKGIKI